MGGHTIALMVDGQIIQTQQSPTLPRYATERITTEDPTGTAAAGWIEGRRFTRAYVYDEQSKAHIYHPVR